MALPLPKEMCLVSGQEKVPGGGGVFIEQDASNIFVVCLRREAFVSDHKTRLIFPFFSVSSGDAMQQGKRWLRGMGSSGVDASSLGTVCRLICLHVLFEIYARGGMRGEVEGKEMR